MLWEALHSRASDLGVADPRSAGGRHVSWDVLREYPQLEEADVRACIAYGAEMARERYIDVPAGRGS